MKTIGKHIIVWLLTVCLLLTTIPFVAAQTPSFAASLFEADNSYLTADQYAGLGFNLGSAAAFDRAQSVYPLASDTNYTLETVKYGWSNPQAIAVMLSSPYWNELDYGSDMNAAGSTSFSLSTGVETSASGEIDLALGLSVSASVKSEIFGNGVEIGGELKAALDKAVEAQVSKASTKELKFQAGAGDDHIALVVFPMASYQYSYKNSSGEKEYLYVNMQFEPTSSVVTLDSYNRVVREHNAAQSNEAQMLPVISMEYMAPKYVTGDPSTGFATADDFPDCLLFENGKLIASSPDAALADDQLVGEVYVSDASYNVSIGNADTGADASLAVSASSGTSHSLGLSLDASVYAEVSAGGDVGFAEVSSSVRATLSAAMGVSVSHAVLNTSGVSYSVGYTDLPASAKTGTTTAGNPTSDYAFTAQLAVWTPTSCGSNISIAPSIIGSLVQFSDPDKMPLYLPDDLHVAGATDTTITLGWTNPDFGSYPFNKRKPSVYEIVTTATGNAGTTYVTIDTVCADEEQFTVTGLSPDTTYTYLLRASDENGRYSAYGPSIDAATGTADCPTIVTQPQSAAFALGEQPIFTVEANATDDSYTLSYQWYKLENNKYGTSWTLVQDSSDNTFNAAYFDTNGVITSANRYNLDGTTYRCVVVEKRGNTAVSVTSDSATLTVTDNYFIRTYNDLREIALSIQNGQTALSGYDYVLANDIAVPSGENWDIPIGSQSVPFSGSFDGQGYTISGLRSNTSGLAYVGLFGVLKNATVCNLQLTNVDMDASCSYVGGICGKAQNSTVSNCTVSGAINGSSDMGGGYSLGGICGYAESGTVIDNCRSDCTMEGQIGAIGGIVGYNYSTVTDCAAFGSVKIHCPVDVDYTTMNAYGGGIVGYNGGSVKNCYSTISPSASSNYGGFTDELTNKNAAVNSYYVNSFDNGSGGKTTDQFASGEVAFLLNGGITDGTQSWYQNIDNGLTVDNYPVLIDNGNNTVYATGDDTPSYTNTEPDEYDDNGNRVFRIKTYDDLKAAAANINSGSDLYTSATYYLQNDIVIPNGEQWTPIGISTISFSGTFDGQGHTISGICFAGTLDYHSGNGFGFIQKAFGAIIRNLHLIDLAVDTTLYTVAGLCADARYTTIDNCSVSGTIKGDGSQMIGGIVGYGYQATITNCISNVDISGSSTYSGGVCAFSYTEGTITNCANLGDITSDSNCNGGIMGCNTAFEISACYNTGKISGSTNANAICFANVADKIDNCYYLDTAASDGHATALNNTQFASGEAAYRLNGGVTDGTQGWYQNLDNSMIPDHYPTLTSNGDNTVYAVLTADTSAIRAYSNYPQSNNASVLTRQSIRTLHRYADTGEHKVVHNFALIDNNKKTITLFVTADVESIGILKHQGLDGNMGEIVLLGDHHIDTRSHRDILATNEQERPIYTDGNGCIFIKIPADLSSLPALKVRYTNKLCENYTATDYTLNIRVVDEALLQTLGASKLSQLTADDPDYDVLHGKATTPTSPSQESPKTGDQNHLVLLLSALIVSGIGTVLCSKRLAKQ